MIYSNPGNYDFASTEMPHRITQTALRMYLEFHVAQSRQF
jgi:hypothetical protein